MKHFYALLIILLIAMEGLAQLPSYEAPQQLYIVGYIDSETTMAPGSENFIGVEMIKEDTQYIANNVGIHGNVGSNSIGTFYLVVLNGEDNFPNTLSYYSTPSLQWEFKDNSSVTKDIKPKELNNTSYNSPKGMNIPIGNYNFIAEFPGNSIQPTLTIEKVNNDIPTSVDDIEVINNGETEYYTLQGMRVNKPTTGLYICKQGSRVSKVMIR